MNNYFVSIIIPFVDESEKYQSLEAESYTFIISAKTEFSAKNKAVKQAIMDFKDDFDDCCKIVFNQILCDDIYETSEDARL